MRLWAAVVLAAVTVACGRSTPAPEKKPADPAMLTKAGYDQTRDPAADLAALIPEAEAHHTRIVLVVGGEWCIWCHYLHNFLEKETDIKERWDDRFLTLHVNYDSEG